MSIRLFTPALLAEGSELSLPPGPARHAQVRRCFKASIRASGGWHSRNCWRITWA